MSASDKQKVAIVHSGVPYAERVEEYLRAHPGARVEAFVVPADVPVFVDEEEAAALLPPAIASAEIVIAIALPYVLLRELPYVMGRGHGRALIAPREEPQWIRPGQMREVTRACGRFGLENAFPKPFCALQPHTPVLRQFCADYKVGQHAIVLECIDGVISAAHCPTSSACGLTAWAAEQLVGRPCDETIPRALVELLHVRPCLASMALDEELGDTIMHEAIRLIEAAGLQALQEARGESNDGNAAS